jgi:hypothetical protein
MVCETGVDRHNSRTVLLNSPYFREMLRECLWENSVKLGSVLGMDLVAGLQECAGHLVGLPTWKCSYSLVVVTHSACSDVYTCPLEK